ncbi:MAG: polysaccharide deacetylase family protein [Candidatus Omnitrophica bacterium]|nr:polysaccharide deacetylase family protein [Candidatus Omnitrophota bacterium]
MKRFLKKIVIYFGFYSGLFEVFRRIMVRKGYVPILLYHHVLEDGKKPAGWVPSCFELMGIGIRKNLLEKQLLYLKERYRLIGLKDYIFKKRQGADLSGAAVVTFDDGFKDEGVALLKKYGIPATIFLFGRSFQEIFYRHRIFFLLDEATILKTIFKTSSGEDILVDISTDEAKRETISRLSLFFGHVDEPAREKNFLNLQIALGVLRDYLPQDVYLTQEDARNLIKDGISFGAHSQTHRNLTLLTDEELSNEIVLSRAQLEALTQEKDVPFAIPLGPYDERVIKAIKKNGMLCNVTSDGGFDSRQEDIYRIKRVFVNTRSFQEFIYKISGFELLVTKIFEKLKRLF